MSVLHLLLNAAGLLLLFTWRGAAVTGAPGGALTLTSTVKPADSDYRYLWLNLVALGALLVLRSIFYWHVGRQIEWTAAWTPGPVTISFRSDLLSRMFVFSFVSFAWAAWTGTAWLVLLLGLAPRRVEGDNVGGMLRAQLGHLSRLPFWIASIGGMLMTLCLWTGLSFALAEERVVPAGPGLPQRLVQGVAVAVYLLLSCKWPLTLIFILRWLDSYVYLGTHPVWEFVNSAARTALLPFRWLRVGGVDLAPVLGLAAVWLLAIGGERLVAQLYLAWPRAW